MDFGSLLKTYRLAAGLSQEGLAERAGIAPSTVASLERGRRTSPRFETVTLLATALGLTELHSATLFAAARGSDLSDPREEAEEKPPATINESGTRRTSHIFPPAANLIGREQEEVAVERLLTAGSSRRLVTLTGPGGVGKTRLALAVASALQDRYRHGAVFVDLSAIRDESLVTTDIARALGLREEGAREPRQLVLNYLRDKEMLLVLDNLEQVIDSVPFIAELIATCADVTVLATSRVPLHLRIEQRFEVPTLEVPAGRWLNGVPIETIARSAAVRLFVDRARSIRPEFELSSENAGMVAEICRRLDGLPLGVELAAARISMLTPAALLTRLNSGIAVLGGGPRDLPERQRALLTTIEWSYGLLPPTEQAIFRRLAVFTGGCTPEAAEDVMSRANLLDTGLDVWTSMCVLVDHSLLQPVRHDVEEPRFKLLNTIGEYALKQLVSSGELDVMRRAHAESFTALALAAREQLFGSEGVYWLQRLDADNDNFRAAMELIVENGDMQMGVRLAGTLWRYWYIRCYFAEAARWLEFFVDRSARIELGPEERIDAVVGLAVIAYSRTDYDRAEGAAEEAITLARRLNDIPNLVISLNILGGVARYRSRFAQSAALGVEAVSISRRSGDQWSLALSLNNLADVARYQGHLRRAEVLASEGLTLSEGLADRWGIAQGYLTLGRVMRDRENYSTAVTYFQRGMEISRELGHTRDVALALADLGRIAHAEGDAEQAVALLSESVSLLTEVDDRVRIAYALLALGRVHLGLGNATRAVEMFRESLEIYRGMGNKLGIAEAIEALAFAKRAQPKTNYSTAVQLLAAAAATRTQIGAPLAPAERELVAKEISSMRQVLGESEFAAAWRDGQALELGATTSLALDL